jgi:hypothetical protein
MRHLFDNELRAIRDNAATLAFLLLVSLAVVLLTRELWDRPAPLRVAIAESDGTCASQKLLQVLVADQTDLNMADLSRDEGAPPIWTVMDRQRLDIVLVCASRADTWIAYTSFRNDTDRQRGLLALKLTELGLRQNAPWYLPPIASPINAVLVRSPSCKAPTGAMQEGDRIDLKMVDPPPPQEAPAILLTCEGGRWIAMTSPGLDAATITKHLATLSVRLGLDDLYWYVRAGASVIEELKPLISINQRPVLSTHGSLWLMPAVSVMVSLLLSFYLASMTIVREVRFGTWNTLRLARGISLPGMLFGKLLLPVLVGIAVLGICATVSAMLGLSVKPDFALLALLVLLPAIIGAVMQGTIVSSLVKSETGAHFCAGGYLIGMLMFSGVLVPTSWSGPTINAISLIFPLSYAIEPTWAVVVNGGGLRPYLPEIRGLLLIDLVVVCLAVGLVYRQWRRM